MPIRRLTCAVLGVFLACAPGELPQQDAAQSAGTETTADPKCRMPTQRTTVRAENGAILETWELALEDILTDELPDEPAFVEYRTAIERDGADLRRPVADPPVSETEEMAAISRDESFNNDLIFKEGVGSVDPISCLDALALFPNSSRQINCSLEGGEQGGRISQSSKREAVVHG